MSDSPSRRESFSVKSPEYQERQKMRRSENSKCVKGDRGGPWSSGGGRGGGGMWGRDSGGAAAPPLLSCRFHDLATQASFYQTVREEPERRESRDKSSLKEERGETPRRPRDSEEFNNTTVRTRGLQTDREVQDMDDVQYCLYPEGGTLGTQIRTGEFTSVFISHLQKRKESLRHVL